MIQPPVPSLIGVGTRRVRRPVRQGHAPPAFSASGQREDTFRFSRKLFRAHNALVLPAAAWED